MHQEEFVDPVTGETKKRQVKYYPDAYKNRIGRSYNIGRLILYVGKHYQG